MTLRWLGALVLGCLSADVASAQEAPALRAHRLVLEGGVVWSGSYDVGDINARLRSNAVGSTPPPFTWFSASSQVGSVPSVAARVGFTLTPTLAIEVGGMFGRPRVAVTITGDAETTRHDLEGEQLGQYLLDGAVVWHLPVRLGPRVRPFVVGGAGYLRQLHEERTLVETGQVYYAGVGARYWIRGGSGTARSLGLRGDLRANLRRGGIDFEDKARVYPTLAVHLFLSL
ncbi:MAG: hypothetical protein RJA55_395 [Acidobacteriota bacterium]|jgi:hypothetical protein